MNECPVHSSWEDWNSVYSSCVHTGDKWVVFSATRERDLSYHVISNFSVDGLPFQEGMHPDDDDWWIECWDEGEEKKAARIYEKAVQELREN